MPRQQLRRLLGNQGQVALLGHDQRVVGRYQRLDPPQRALEKALLTDQRQEGLGAVPTAERPEPGTGSAGQDNRVH